MICESTSRHSVSSPSSRHDEGEGVGPDGQRGVVAGRRVAGVPGHGHGGAAVGRHLQHVLRPRDLRAAAGRDRPRDAQGGLHPRRPPIPQGRVGGPDVGVSRPTPQLHRERVLVDAVSFI